MDFMRFYPDSLPSMTNADKKTRKIIHKIRELEVNMKNCQIKRDMKKFKYFSAERNVKMMEYSLMRNPRDPKRVSNLQKSKEEFLKMSSQFTEPVLSRGISFVDNKEYLERLIFK